MMVSVFGDVVLAEKIGEENVIKDTQIEMF